jgi:hypothetical protein
MAVQRARFESIPEWTRAEVEAAIDRNEPDELLYAVLAAALYAEDPKWAEDVCYQLASHPHFNVRGNALLGFAHIARIHRVLDRQRVQPLLEAGMRDGHEYVRGHAYDAVDAVEHFLGWTIPQPEVT